MYTIIQTTKLRLDRPKWWLAWSNCKNAWSEMCPDILTTVTQHVENIAVLLLKLTACCCSQSVSFAARYQLLWLEQDWGKDCEQLRLFLQRKWSQTILLSGTTPLPQPESCECTWAQLFAYKVNKCMSSKNRWQCPYKSLWWLDKQQTFVQLSKNIYNNTVYPLQDHTPSPARLKYSASRMVVVKVVKHYPSTL